MNQSLWQIVFNIALIGFVARHAAAGLAVYGGRGAPGLVALYVGLLAVCGFAALAIWGSRRLVSISLVALALAFTTSTAVELATHALGVPTPWLLAQLAVGLGGAGALLWLNVRDEQRQQPRTD